tara:strand:- start:34 stop:339 length:306 start_codon:yes stop_codon:yes gene_type:complete
MKKIVIFVPIIFLILATTITKNSTKKLDKNIFKIKENLRLLEYKYELVLLDYNYLTSPKKLMEYQQLYFDNQLVEKNIKKLKLIEIENSNIFINNIYEMND